MSKKSLHLTALFLLWGLAAGMVSPVQTAVNGRLRIAVASPFLASMISFSTGTLFLILITLIIDHRLSFKRSVIRESHWWLWIGGPLGVIFVTSNILLLPKLGAELTVVAVLCGQMLIALVIDHFGWFSVPQHKINWQRLIGMVFMIAGILLIQRF
ncbi:MAG: DMT family transporter [Sporolactobacillus sp.]